VEVYLGLGSNLGDRLANLQGALDRLNATDGLRIVASSRVWETDPIGGPDQPEFLNAVVRGDTELRPLDLLAATQAVESSLGRIREVRWGPRTIDIDIELIDGLLIDEDPVLTVPHPRMSQRAFVLFPLLDLTGDLTLPDGTRLTEVRLGPDASRGARPFAPPLRVVA
jgi:2-amino-4-hydroxy-6-hydroxymethyldihydropteridine diphosphokinase